MKNKIISVLAGLLLIAPSFALADTNTDVQRISLLQQLVSLMQELIQLEAQVGATQIATTTPQLFGSIIPPSMNDITIEVKDNGSVDIAIAGTFAKGMITTYPTSDNPAEIAAGLKAPNTPDTNVRRNGNVLKENGVVSNYFPFDPDTEYTWIIDLTDSDGNVHSSEGTFTTPHFTREQAQ